MSVCLSVCVCVYVRVCVVYWQTAACWREIDTGGDMYADANRLKQSHFVESATQHDVMTDVWSRDAAGVRLMTTVNSSVQSTQ